MLLITYLERMLSQPEGKSYDRIRKKYDLVLKTIDNIASGLEGIDPIKGKLKVFYYVLTRRYPSAIITYLNKNKNIDPTERSQSRIILKRIIAVAYNINKMVLQYIASYNSTDIESIEKQKNMRKNIILKTYILFKLIEKINSFFEKNETQYTKFINYVYSKIFDLFEREKEVKRVYKNDEKFFKNFPDLIDGLRPHKSLEEILSTNKKTEKKDKELMQNKTYYLNNKDGFNFLITPITSSQFYIEEPTPFDFLIQKQGNSYEVISVELSNIIIDNDYQVILDDLHSKQSLLSSMFNIKNKNNDKVNLKDINSIKKINVLKLGKFFINGIEKLANKEVNLKINFSNSIIGEIEIES